MPHTDRVRSTGGAWVALYSREAAAVEAGDGAWSGEDEIINEDTPHLLGCGVYFKLATSYFRMAFRHTIIGATAFHFRVRNGNGWGHCAMVTRLQTTRLSV